MESVTVRLVALDANDNIITDSNGDYVMANEVVEGETASYMAILLDPNGDRITTATGNVTVEYNDGTAKVSDLDYDSTKTQVVALNSVIDKDTLDDYIADNGETFTINVVDDTYTNASAYENVVHDTTAVTTTITDDDIAPDAKNNTNTATEDGRESITAEDETDDAQSATGNVITDPEADVGSNPLSITAINFNGTVINIPVNGANVTVTGDYGTLTINNTGAYTYDVNENITDSWNVGKSEVDEFTYTLSDGYNPDDTAKLSITVEGRDDAPVITSITANDRATHTINGILDMDGDDNGDIVNPTDLLNGDGNNGIQFNENNGNIVINMGNQNSSMSVDYFGGNAGYKNVLGYYEKDSNGNFTDIKIIYVDKGDDDGQGGNFDKFPDGINLGTLNDLNGEVGFFIVPNGYSNSSIANAVDNGWNLSIDANNKVVFTNPDNTTETASISKAYYTDNSMSTDGRDHAVITMNDDGSLTIGMEDLPQNSTDQDYDDVVFTIKPCETLGTPITTTLLTEEFEGVSKDMNAGDTNNGGSWYVDHGTNGDNILVSDNGIQWTMNQAGIEMRVNDGVHGLDTADGSGNYVELDAHTSGTNSSITTTVDLGLANDTFNLTFNYTPRPGAEDSSDMKFSLAGNEVEILVDAQGNITTNTLSDDVSVTISPISGTPWYQVDAQFTNIDTQTADLNFQAVGVADTLGAYIDHIKLEGTDYSNTNKILSNIELSDVDDTNLESAKIELTNFKAGDTLSGGTNSYGIAIAITNGVVELSGSATVEQYEEVLESFTFETTSDIRDVRTFEYTVFDGDKHSNTMSVDVNIGGCNLNTGDYTNTVVAIDDYGYQDNPQGEFEVAAFEDGKAQSEPDVTSLKDGGFVVAWTEVSGDSYKSAIVNDFNNDGDTNDSGETVWQNGLVNHDVFIQRYDSDGEPIGDATRVNTFVTNVNEDGGRSQHDVNVVGLENGNYLVTWTSDDQYIGQDNWDNGSRYIQGQIYDVNGNPMCGEFTVSRAEYDPIVALPDGGFIVTWSADARLDNTDHDGASNNPTNGTDNPIYSDTHDGSGFGVIAQRFDALGNEVGDRVIVNQTTLNDQFDSDIVMIDDNTAIMTWQSQNGIDGDFDIYAQTLKLTANGLEVVSNSDIIVANGGENQTNPEVTALSNGTAIITYQSDANIMAKTVSSTGVGSEVTIAAGANPVITALAAGVVIVYEENGTIFAKTFDGTNISNATVISEDSTDQTLPAVTTLEDGGYVISWQDENGISAHRYNADGTEYHQNDYDMYEDTSITLTVEEILANDYDPEKHDFEIISVQNPEHGTVVLNDTNNDGKYDSVTFTPNHDYSGPAQFDYTIKDELGATDPATVFLNVKELGEPSIFVGTLCAADIQSHNVVVHEGENALLAVKVSGAEIGSTVSLSLADGTALITEDYDSTFYYSFDGQNWTEYNSNNPIEVTDADKFMVKMSTIKGHGDELDENFTLHATLNSPGSDIVSDSGTVTIIDYDKEVIEDDSNTKEDGSWNVKLFDNNDAIFINDPQNGSVYESIKISGIPSDALLKDGNGNIITVANGEVILTDNLDAIRELTVTPATDSSENIYLQYTVTSKDIDGNSFNDTFDQTIRIVPDADAPETQGDKSYTGLEGTWIALDGLYSNITETNIDHDNETLYTRIQIIGNNGVEPVVEYQYTKDDGSVITTNATKGWITVPQDALDTLQFKTSDVDFNGDIKFKLQTRARDIDELNDGEKNIDDAWETDYLIVNITGDADAPIISMRTSDGLEDAGRDNDTGAIIDGTQGIAIELDAYTNFGSENIEFIISDIPDDAYLFDRNGNEISRNSELITETRVDTNGNSTIVTYPIGTVVVVSLSQAQGLTIVPPHDSNENFDLTVVGKSTETNYDISNGGLQTNISDPQTLTVQLTGVIDAPVVETNTTGGDEDTWISFGLNISSGEEQYLSETLYATLEGIPKDAEIRIVDAQGNDLGIDSLTLASVHANSTDWRIDNDLLADLNAGTKDFQILPAKDFSGEIEFGLEVTAIENDGDRTSTRETFTLDINPVVDTTSGDMTQVVNEDTWTELSLPWNVSDTTGSESITSANITIPSDIQVKINGQVIDNTNGAEISLNINDSVEILAPIHSNVDFNGIVFTKNILDDSTHDSNLDNNDEQDTKEVITNITIDMKGISDGWDVDSNGDGTLEYDGFQVQDIPFQSTTTTTTLYTAYAYEGDGYKSFESNGNITAANAAVTYVDGQGIGVGNQNGMENGNQTSAFENNESLLIDFGKEISDFQFTITDVSTDSLNGSYIVYDEDRNILGEYDITTPFPESLEGFQYVTFDAYKENGMGHDNEFYVNITSVDGVNVPSTNMLSGQVTATTIIDTNEATPLSTIITKNVTVEDAHDINDASESEYYIIQNNDTNNTSWSIEGGINAGNGTWIVTDPSTATVKIHSLTDGDGTLDLQIIPVTQENDGDVKFDPAHPFTIAYGDGSGSYSGTTPIPDTTPTISVNSIEQDGLEDTNLTNTDSLTVTSTNADASSFVVTGVVNGSLTSTTGFYALPNGNMVTIDKDLVDNITPKTDFNGKLDINVTAIATNTTNGAEATVNHTITVDVAPVADSSSISATGGSETDGETINLNLAIASGDSDGSESLSGDITITAQNGGTFSNGTDTITIPSAQLGNVTYTPPAYVHGAFSFAIAYTMVDTDAYGDNDTVTTNVNTTFSINLSSHVDNVSVTLEPTGVSVLEGQALPLGLNLTQADSDGSEVASVVVTGLPEGAVLSVGTIRTLEDGTREFVLKASEVADAKVIADPYYSGDFTITARAYSYDIKSSEISESGVVSKDFSITPIASDLTINADGFGGDEDTAISVKLDLVLEDIDTYSDTNETVIVTFSGYEAGSTFTIDGTNTIGAEINGHYVIENLTPAQAESLAIIPPANFSGVMSNISVSVQTKDGDNILDITNNTNATDTFSITVDSVTDEATLTVNNAESTRIDETNTFALDISASVPDSNQSLDVILTGVQGTLNHGSYDSNTNEWTLSQNDLTDLTITPNSDVTGDFDISVKAITQDGTDSAKETTSASITVKVDIDDTFNYADGDIIDGLVGNDTLNITTFDDDETVDLSTIASSVKNIEVVDFTDGENQTIHIDLEDVVAMTDDDNDLVIKGDNGDIINLDENEGWERSDTTTNIDGQDFAEYTNTSNTTISVFIDTDIDTTGLN
ncbi:MAG: cadherin-like domain-containing protein [Arcobacteraceae bacterium]|nr:cadherin-like domain-containing protein [Arcobacteraceae bacterium]